MKNFKKGYTLVEALLVLMIIGIFATLVVLGLGSPEAIHRKQISELTKNFYQAVENVAIYFTANTKRADKNNDGKIDTEEFGGFFTTKLAGERINPSPDPQNPDSCAIIREKLNTFLSTGDGKGDNPTADLVCADFQDGTMAAYYYNSDCDGEYLIKEYYEAEDEQLADENVNAPALMQKICGYIAYGIEKQIIDSEELEIGKNVFTIPINKNGIKHRRL